MSDERIAIMGHAQTYIDLEREKWERWRDRPCKFKSEYWPGYPKNETCKVTERPCRQEDCFAWDIRSLCGGGI
jgi:hypothetical protein